MGVLCGHPGLRLTPEMDYRSYMTEKKECPVCYGDCGAYEPCGEDYTMVWLECAECEGSGEVAVNQWPWFLTKIPVTGWCD